MAGWNNKQTKLVNKRWKLNPQLFQELDILYESKHQRILPEIKWEKRTEEVLGWSYVWRRNELGGKEALCTWLLLFGLFAKSQPLRFGAVSTAPAETEGRRQAETRAQQDRAGSPLLKPRGGLEISAFGWKWLMCSNKDEDSFPTSVASATEQTMQIRNVWSGRREQLSWHLSCWVILMLPLFFPHSPPKLATESR